MSGYSTLAMEDGQASPLLRIHQASDGIAARAVLVLNASYEPINICAAGGPSCVLKGVAMRKRRMGIFSMPRGLPCACPRLSAAGVSPNSHQTRLCRARYSAARPQYCQYCGEIVSSGDLT